ncbi:MAG TPA: PAS domain S-box protein [Candidatus Methanoperedens sp.]
MTNGKKILVVEDEPIIAMEIESRLKGSGYEISGIVSSGKDAVLKSIESPPDLILMDIMLKGDMDGVQAAEEIRRSMDIPIIYVTAYADGDTLERAKITEPFGYVIKPFLERELIAVIEMALYKNDMVQKLKESEKWLSTTLESMEEGVIATDINRLVKFMNPVSEALTGWTQKEALGRDLNEIFNINEEENNIVLVSRDGTERPILETVSPIKNHAGDIIGTLHVFKDNTGRKVADWAEKALVQSEELYRSIVELSPTAILIQTEGKIVFSNSAGAKLLGAKIPRELVGKRFMDIVQPERREFVAERLRQMIRKEKIMPASAEKFIRLDGSVMNVEAIYMPFTYKGEKSIQVIARKLLST